MGLRMQDPVPEWISHIALVQDGRVKVGDKTTMLQELNDFSRSKATSHSTTPIHTPIEAKAFVDMQNVNVRYHERHVSYLHSRT